MCEIVAVFLVADTDLQSSGLRVAQVGAAADFEVFLLARGPGFNVQGLDLQIGQVAGAAFQRAYGDVHAAEEFHGVVPQLIEPHGRILGLADDDHLLLLELVDAVDASLLDAVGADFLAEAGAVTGQRLGQLILVQHLTDVAADHGVLGRTDQVQVFTLDLVHHVLHFLEAHDALYDVAVDHERGNEVLESLVDHEVAGIAQDAGVQSGDVALQVVEAVAGRSTGAVQIDAGEHLHDVDMVRDLPFGHDGFAEAFQFHVLGVVLADGHGVVDHLRDDHHALVDLSGQFFFLLFKRCQFVGHLGDLFLGFFRFVLLAGLHQLADLLGHAVAVGSQFVASRLRRSQFFIHGDDFVHHGQLFVLELLADVLFDRIGVCSDKFDI